MIRFGTVGTNWITDNFLQAARGDDCFTLAAVCSRTEERARQFADKHGAADSFTDVEEMAASGKVDAVYIASPSSFHARQAIACMKRGVHVLCEKPIASNARELRGMIEAARESGVVLMEAMKSTLQPNFAAVRDNLHRIGRVRRYFAGFCQYSSRYDAYRRGELPNAFDPQYSNGALMDLGTYCLYPLVVLFGRPDAVKANGLLLASGVDGEGSLILQYPNMEAVVLYSKIADSALPAEIQGEDGTIVLSHISRMEETSIRFRDKTVEKIGREQSPHTMVYEVNEFINLIKQGRSESDVNSLANSLGTMEIMDEARRQIGLVYPADRV